MRVDYATLIMNILAIKNTLFMVDHELSTSHPPTVHQAKLIQEIADKAVELNRSFIAGGIERTDRGERKYCECGTELEWTTRNHEGYGDVDIGCCSECGKGYTEGES